MPSPAAELYEMGRSALAERRMDEADRALRRALSLCGPSEAELAFRVRISGSWVVFERSGLQAALAVLDEVRAGADAAGFPGAAAIAGVQIGILRARAGELAAAWHELNLVDPGLLPEPDRARFLLNRGAMASELGRLDEAVIDLGDAARFDDDTPITLMASHNLGWVQFVRGDLPAALEAIGDADRVPWALDRGVVRLDRARVLLEAGLAGEALEVLETITPTSALNHAEVDLERARAELLLGDGAVAAVLARDAARRFATRGEPFHRRRCLLVALQAQPDRVRATRLWREARSSGDHWVAQQAAAVAVGLWGPRGQPSTALLRDTAVLARSPVISRRVAGQLSLARLDGQNGRYAAARRRLRAASRDLLEAQLGFASLELRAAMAIHGQAMASLELELAERLPRRRLDALIDVSERWRAASRPSPRVTPETDPALSGAATRLRRLRMEHRDNPGDRRLITAVTHAERELQRLSWTTRSSVPPQVRTLDPTELRRAARSQGVTIVVCLPRGPETWAVLLGPRPTRIVRLGDSDDLSALVAAAHADLAARAVLSDVHPMHRTVAASLAARLADLRSALIAPLETGTGALVVVPTAALTGVPWTALAAGPVTVSPTASSWVLGGRRLAGPRVTALAGPALSSADGEAASVRRRWSVSTPTPTLAEALAGFDLVHVAAHGRHRISNPLFSSLHLAEGDVVAHELEGLPLRASHVVLSACEVGRSASRPGDQPLGLTSTLLASGAACVVAPVAPVNDDLAAAVMDRYHRGLAAGEEAAVALHDAAADDPAAGAFVCFGSPWRVDPGALGTA